MVPNVGSNRLSGTPTEGTWGHFAGLCGPYINTTTSVSLLCVQYRSRHHRLKIPTVPLKKTKKSRFGTDLGSGRNDGVRWGARLTTVHRQFFGLGRSTAAQMPLVSCLSSHAISRGIG